MSSNLCIWMAFQARTCDRLRLNRVFNLESQTMHLTVAIPLCHRLRLMKPNNAPISLLESFSSRFITVSKNARFPARKKIYTFQKQDGNIRILQTFVNPSWYSFLLKPNRNKTACEKSRWLSGVFGGGFNKGEYWAYTAAKETRVGNPIFEF